MIVQQKSWRQCSSTCHCCADHATPQADRSTSQASQPARPHMVRRQVLPHGPRHAHKLAIQDIRSRMPRLQAQLRSTETCYAAEKKKVPRDDRGMCVCQRPSRRARGTNVLTGAVKRRTLLACVRSERTHDRVGGGRTILVRRGNPSNLELSHYAAVRNADVGSLSRLRHLQRHLAWSRRLFCLLLCHTASAAQSRTKSCDVWWVGERFSSARPPLLSCDGPHTCGRACNHP